MRSRLLSTSLPEGPPRDREPSTVPFADEAAATWRLRPHPSEPGATPGYHWFAVVALTCAVGIAACAIDDAFSRSTRSTSQLLFWVGLLLIVAPVVARVLSRGATRGERIALVVLLGFSLYLVKVVRSPFGFDMTDELAHAPNSAAILRTHKLFSPNSILPVTAHYPGLESLDTAFASLSGLSPYGAGLVLIGAARVVIMLALYLLFERLSGSSRIAALGAIIYTANASFLFFDAQVSYESLALPLLVLVLFAVAEWRTAHDQWSWSIAIVVVTLALVATHHLTSYALVVVLAALCAVQLLVTKWQSREPGRPGGPAARLAKIGLSEERKALVERYMVDAEQAKARGLSAVQEPARPKPADSVPQAVPKRRMRSLAAVQTAPWVFLLVALAATVGWLTFVASSTVGYLTSPFTKAFLSTIHTLSGESGPRQLFTSTQGGHQAPLLERAVGLGSYALMAAAVPFGLKALRRRFGRDYFTLVLGLASLAFFALAALRLAPGAWETAERASEFLFVGLGFVLALTGLDRWSPRPIPWLGRLVTVALVCVIFAGGVISGTPPSIRLSQPYLIQAGRHTIEPEGRQLARWAAANLRPGSRYAAPEADARFLATYADGYAVTGSAWDVDAILRTTHLRLWQRQNLARARLRYVVVDRQGTSFGDPRGYFFGHRPGDAAVDLLPRAVARKFDRYGVDRVYDSGAIKVYELTGAARATRKH